MKAWKKLTKNWQKRIDGRCQVLGTDGLGEKIINLIRSDLSGIRIGSNRKWQQINDYQILDNESFKKV